MAAQGGDHFVDAPPIELLASLPGPLMADPAADAVDGLGDLEQMPFGVEDVDDLDRVGEVLVGEVPDPRRAIAEDDPAPGRVEAAAFGLAHDAPGEGRGLDVGVTGGDGLDGSVVGGGTRIAHGVPLLVGGLRRPHDGEPGLAGLGAAVGLLALAALDLRLARRHAGAVEAEIEGGGVGRFGFDNPAFVAGDLTSQCLGVTLQPTDWTERYSTTPVLIETFVQTPRYTGAVYRASGWIRVGTTLGRGRYDRHQLYDKPRKDVWLRPLRRDWKRTLNR